MNNRPFAVFDIDGTLIRWQLYHAVADALVQQGHISREAYQQVRQARAKWKKRESERSFKEYESTLVQLIDITVTSIQVHDWQAACQAVLANYKDQVYTYTRTLIQTLRAKQYILFALSASQIEIVGPLSKLYGFDDFGGSEYKIKNGRFTGQKTVMKKTQKLRTLQLLVEKHHASWRHSFAIGDSESDIPMLSIVEKPLAFNPTKLLFRHATHHNWPIVLERKNVIYQLKSDHGHYRLQS